MKLQLRCELNWQDLVGDDDQCRHCESCDRPVYNLSGLSPEDAGRLVAARGDSLSCVHFLRADGSIIHNGDPFAAATSGPKRAGAGAKTLFAALLVVHLNLVAFSSADVSETWYNPFAAAASLFGPSRAQAKQVVFLGAEVACRSDSECFEKASAALAHGATFENTDHPAADYLRYEQLERARHLLAQTETKPPPRLQSFEPERVRLKKKLHHEFSLLRREFREFQRGRSWVQMGETVRKLEARFPNDRSTWGQVTQNYKRQMLDDGIWPLTREESEARHSK